MARGSFGGGASEYVADVNNRGLVGRTVTVWTAETGGTQVTDLLVGGVAATSITSGVGGRLPVFQGPDNVVELWADAGGGVRFRLDAYNDEDATDTAVDAAVGRAVGAGTVLSPAAAAASYLAKTAADATFLAQTAGTGRVVGLSEASARQQYGRQIDSSTLPTLDAMPDNSPGLSSITGFLSRHRADSIAQADGSSVATWADDSGNGHALTQATAGNQPILKTGVVNGRAVVRFTGGNWWLRRVYGATYPNATVIAVARPRQGLNKFLLDTNPTSGMNLYSGSVGLHSNLTDFGAVAVPGFAVYRMDVRTTTGTNMTLSRNGAGLGVAPCASVTELTVGANAGGAPSFFSDWDVAEVIVFSRTLTPDEGRVVDRELAATYGLRTTQSVTVRQRTRPTQASGQASSVVLPESYIAGRQTPVLLYCHGSGGDDQSAFSTNLNAGVVQDMALALGFIVASPSLAGQSTMGNSAALDTVQELLAYTRAQFTTGKVVVHGQSMGSLAALLLIALRGEAGVSGWLGTYPVTNLADAANTWGTSFMGPSYGVSAPGTTSSVDYATKTAGHDPQLYPASAYAGLRFRAYASAADTTVSKTQNTDLFISKVAPVAREASVYTATGPHGDASHFQLRDIGAFLTRCLSDSEV